MKNSVAGCIVAAASCVAAAGSARGDIINIVGDTANSTEGLAAFAGSVSYLFSGGSSGVLTVSLTNTTAANAARITGFAFDMGTAGGGRTADLTSATHPFLELTNVSAPPFGTYDSGAALGGSWTGGGSPNAGIAIGATGVFTFAVTASDASALTASDFVFGGDNEFGFVVRVRAINPGDASDKVPAMIPSAGTLALLPLVLAGRRRR